MSDERQGPYSRVYWSILIDRKFDGIREDAKLLGTWTLLLVVADGAYPSPAFVPPTLTKASVARLVEAELIDLLPGHRYLVRGLAAERDRRAEAGRVGGLASGRSRKPDGSSERLRTTVERPLNDRSTENERPSNQSKSESEDESETSTRQAETEAPRAPDPADVYWTLTGRYPTDKTLSWIDDLSSSYGPEAVIRAIATTHAQDRSANTLLGRTQDVLRAEARALSLKEQSTVRANLKERRAAPREDIDQEALTAEIRRLMEPAA